MDSDTDDHVNEELQEQQEYAACLLEQEQHDNHIKYLWDTVMLPYIESIDRQVLDKLTHRDYEKFYAWIIDV